MALIVIKDYSEIQVNERNYLFYADSVERVQKEYCSIIEGGRSRGIPFLFDDPDVCAYLERYGVRYKGNYLLESDDWGTDASGEKEQFVTYLYYTLQLSCIALYYKEVRPVIGNRCLFELEYILPVLEKKDVYLLLDDFTDVWWLEDVVEAGIELRIAGFTSKNCTAEKVRLFLCELEKKECYLTRELDAEVFVRSGIQEQKNNSRRMTLYEYVSEHCRDSEDELESYISEVLYYEINVIEKGMSNFTGCYRRYPIHYLFYIDGDWKYISNNSVKNPSYLELLEDAVLNPRVFDFDKQCHVDVSRAEKIFCLVLDCDEICDARKYWENVCFLVKFDRKTKEMEICDEKSGLLEFHELLQKSTNL